MRPTGFVPAVVLEEEEPKVLAQETLVAVFDAASQADAAASALISGGVRAADIERHAATALAAPQTAADAGGFWNALFGGETTMGQNTVYDRVVRAGGEVMTVLLRDGERDADPVMTILAAYHPVDVVERAASLDLGTPVSVASPGAPIPDASERSMTLSEESLAVGKRTVDRGATRLRRIVQSQPVERDVTLREERVSVTRRSSAPHAVVGPDAFVDQVIEMLETGEELVVSKRVRVREEVVMRREVRERVETVRDTLRREEASIERLEAAPNTPDPKADV